MQKYLYLSLTPEALIASMLPPSDFGNYLAVGTKKRTRGQAIFFEVDQDLVGDHFPMERMEKCVPDENGKPKRSVYLSIYRVLEHLPLEALKNLYLVTDDGRVLEIEKSVFKPEADEEFHLHLYQQLCPVVPRIASSLEPKEFMKFVTDQSHPVSVPKLIFVELNLNGLAEDPQNAPADNLPYKNIDHVRDCLLRVKYDKEKPTKTVIRVFRGDLVYRTCKNGFFVGDQNTLLYYPLPTQEELQEKYYPWWRSSLTIGFS